jgi:nucleoside-diphosphate-sugar epimerase
MKLEQVAIVGATGPTGIHLGRELVARGRRVRVISRSTANLEAAFPAQDVERVAADALAVEEMREAVAGCDLVVNCIGLPADRIDQHEVAARAVVAGADATGARCLHVSSYWAFLPVQRLPVDEEHPRVDGNPYIQARRRAEDVFLAAGGAVAHLPDFFGPEVHTSTLQRPLEEAVEGRAMGFLGAADCEREYAYVPDAMHMVANLLDRDEAYGRSWIVPGSGGLSPERAGEIAGRHLGRPVKVRAAPRYILEIMSAFSPTLRAFRPMLPHYVKPIHFDGSRLRGLLGEAATTPYEESIPATLDWLQRRDTAGG